jgi:hypothetical protein
VLDRRVHLVARRVDPQDRVAGLSLERRVELLLEAVPADGALHLEGRQALPGELLDVLVLVHADVAEDMRRRVAVGVGARVRGVHLKGRVDRKALDQLRKLLGFQVVDERVGQEELALQVALEGRRVDAPRAPGDPVHLVHVLLDDAHVREALDLRAGGQVLVARRLVGGAYRDVRLPEIGAELVQVEDDRKAGPVLHQLAALPVEDVAAGPRDDDPPLVLLALLLVVDRALDDLLVGEPASQDEKHERHEAVEGDDPRVESGLGFDEAAGAFGGSGHCGVGGR